MTKELIDSRLKAFKTGLTEFIEEGKITENKKERNINNQDIIDYINK